MREKFKHHLRPGSRDYLLGDHFDDIVLFLDSQMPTEAIPAQALANRETQVSVSFAGE